MTPEEYRRLRARRAQAQPPIPPRKCRRCGVEAVLKDSQYCGVCGLLAAIAGKPSQTR